MTIVKIEHSNSKELIQYNGRSEWRGFVIHAEVGENETVEEAGKKLLVQMEQLHKLYSGNLYPDYSSIPSHPMYAEPSRISNQELDAAQREMDIETYYQIINMKGASVKYLEAHRSAIEKLNDEALTQAFNNKINTLQ